MSTSSRREKIETLLAAEPHDVFLRYSLAMELAKESQHDRSLELFRQLSEESPPYVPAFFMAAQLLAQLGRINDARTELRSGIDVARQQGDSHAAGEMSEFLASLGEVGE
ncbi:MAG: tetratricopeptide repeat protein [Pirellulaceae bacterium]